MQVAACGIIGKQIFSVWDYIFTNKCDNCRGTGRMICKNCRGTKTLRKRPGEFHIFKSDLADQSARDLYVHGSCCMLKFSQALCLCSQAGLIPLCLAQHLQCPVRFSHVHRVCNCSAVVPFSQLLHNARRYRCVYCGPESKHDAALVPDTQQQIDMLEYLNCQANIKAAIAGR